MKTNLIITALVLILSCGILTAADDPNSDKQTDGKDAASEEVKVAAVVDEYKIMQSDVDELVRTQIEKIKSQIPPQYVEQYIKQNIEPMKQQALNGLIVEHLLDKKMKDSDIEITDERVELELNKMASAEEPPLSMKEFKALLEAQGADYDDFKSRIKKGLGYNQLFEREMGDNLKITEEEAKQYYQKNSKKYSKSEQIKASHILLKPEEFDNDPNKAEDKAKELLKKVKQGADFAELAKEYSNCPSSQKGGDLGFFGRGQMVPPFDKAAFALKPGQISDLVKTQYGYHIIKVTDHKDSSKVPFEQARDEIMRTLKTQKTEQHTQEYVEKLMEGADITYPGKPSGKKKESGESSPGDKKQ